MFGCRNHAASCTLSIFPKSLALMRAFPVKYQRSILRRLSKDCCPRSLGFCFKSLVLPTTYKKKEVRTTMGTRRLIESGMTLVVHIELFNTQDLISNSPYCLPYTSCDVSLENLVLDQLITCLLDIVLILRGEILSWSLMGVKGLINRTS